MTTDALQILKDMHQEIGGLFELLANTNGINEKLTLFQIIKDELEVYAMIEQRVLYPAVSSSDELTEIIDRSFEEHDETSDRVEEIDQMEHESEEEFTTAVSELAALFARHVANEERELLPRISDFIEDSELVDLGLQMNEYRSLGLAA